MAAANRAEQQSNASVLLDDGCPSRVKSPSPYLDEPPMAPIKSLRHASGKLKSVASGNAFHDSSSSSSTSLVENLVDIHKNSQLLLAAAAADEQQQQTMLMMMNAAALAATAKPDLQLDDVNHSPGVGSSSGCTPTTFARPSAPFSLNELDHHFGSLQKNVRDEQSTNAAAAAMAAAAAYLNCFSNVQQPLNSSGNTSSGSCSSSSSSNDQLGVHQVFNPNSAADNSLLNSLASNSTRNLHSNNNNNNNMSRHNRY